MFTDIFKQRLPCLLALPFISQCKKPAFPNPFTLAGTTGTQLCCVRQNH
jgi:hypothetical protein